MSERYQSGLICGHVSFTNSHIKVGEPCEGPQPIRDESRQGLGGKMSQKGEMKEHWISSHISQNIEEKRAKSSYKIVFQTSSISSNYNRNMLHIDASVLTI